MGDHVFSTIKHQDHVLLDQPLLRLPYELLRNNFRAAHFTVEKDSTSIKALLKETATGAVNGRDSQEQVLKNLDTMIAKMRGVKRKLATYAEEEARLYRQTGERIGYLGELYSMHSVDDVKYETWSRKRLDRVLVDYLLRHGYYETAGELSLEKGIEDLVDVQTFQQMGKIQAALRGGSVAEALTWCQDNKKELRKKESNLEFMLRFQQYIELVRTGSQPKLLEAITHAKKYLISSKATYPEELNKVCGLLAYPPSATGAHKAYEELYSSDRWEMLAELFTTTHNDLLALPAYPLLHIALSSGLSALKTPACHISTNTIGADGLFSPNKYAVEGDGNGEPHTEPGQRMGRPAISSPDAACPICSTELNELSRCVPYAHHTKSHVDSDLLLLPNGNVFGQDRLEEYARKSGLQPDQVVKDLKTGQLYRANSLKKVFIT